MNHHLFFHFKLGAAEDIEVTQWLSILLSLIYSGFDFWLERLITHPTYACLENLQIVIMASTPFKC